MPKQIVLRGQRVFWWKTWRIFPKRQLPVNQILGVGGEAKFDSRKADILKQKHLPWGRCLMDGDGGRLKVIENV